MSQAVTVINQAPVGMPPALLSSVGKYLDSMGNKLSKHHRDQFIEICAAFSLNPFLREIYGIPYGDKFSIIVGYEVYLKRAETSGLLVGWKSYVKGEGKSMLGCVEISRKDWATPFYHEVLFSEYDQGNSMWKSKPQTMIKKVAIAQGFRMAFPVELGGMPYTSDEIAIEPSAPRALSASVPLSSRFDTPVENMASPEELTQLSKLLIERGYKESDARREYINSQTGKMVKQLSHSDVQFLLAELSVEDVTDSPDPVTADAIPEMDEAPPKGETCPACGSEKQRGHCRNMTCIEAMPFG